MNKDIYLSNSLSNKKEIFVPIDDKKIRMYVCGPTVYDDPHIGNARPLVIFDILFKGPKGQVIPDNIIKKPPTAELRNDQKDTDSLPEYDILDEILKGLVEQEISVEKIISIQRQLLAHTRAH